MFKFRAEKNVSNNQSDKTIIVRFFMLPSGMAIAAIAIKIDPQPAQVQMSITVSAKTAFILTHSTQFLNGVFCTGASAKQSKKGKEKTVSIFHSST